ncbi:MAG: hypothetical protein KDD40_10425 [Bdellovibrionales bacterium]|nr:hypothetical protein [Bdellovibrionales bacterium]
MKYIFALSILFSFMLITHNYKTPLCEGILPDNDLYIPESEVSPFSLDRQKFDEVLNRIESVYEPIIKKMGGTLEVKRLWSDGKVNASAMRLGSRFIINMYGGMARYPSMTEEGMALTACHEMGHHLAGAPKVKNKLSNWASNEGQSDYFAGLKCFRKIYSDDENIVWAYQAFIHPVVLDKCTRYWPTLAEQAACARFSMAGLTLAHVIREIKFPNDDLGFDTPDTSIVTNTEDGHPRPQCRLDTYIAAALCDQPLDESLSDSDPNLGVCTRNAGYTESVRPLCWYKP